MPISKVVLDNQSKENVDLDGQYVRVPHGTTAQRPSSPAGGQLRFNTDLGTLEQYNTNTNAWAAIDSPPIISGLAYSGSNNATEPAGGEVITLTGSNFKTGFSVAIGGTAAASTTFVNSTTIRFTTPVKTAGDYDVTFTNNNGLAATLTNGISVNGIPSFTTAAGSLGSVVGGESIPTITIVAAEPDSGTLAYSVTTGALPAGLSLGSANGQITGTPTSPSATTTTNFTITATDDESQTTARAFSLQVLRPVQAYLIAKSLEFNGTSHYLYKNGWPTATDSSRSTWSAWIKKTEPASESTYGTIFGTNTGNNAFNRIGINSAGMFDALRVRNSSSIDQMEFTGSHVLDDTNSWYHLFVSVDFNQSGNAKIVAYVNGVLYNTWDSNLVNTGTGFSYYQWYNGSSAKMEIGRHNTNSSNALFSQMMIAEVHMIDGQIKSHTDFGEFYNGVWVPKNYTGTYGNCGFHLDFADSSNIGNDVSGNNNDFTSSGLQARHILLDTPTNSFPHLDYHPSQTSTKSEIDGRARIWKVLQAQGKLINTTLPTTGKWYWEWRVSSNNWYQYLVNESTTRGASAGATTVYSIAGNGASASPNSTAVSETLTSSASGDIFANLWDGDTGTMEIYQNNSKVAEFNAFTIDGPYYVSYDRSTSTSISGISHYINFGQDASFNGAEGTPGTNADANGFGQFKYAPPSGYLSICTQNLPDPLPIVEDVRPEDFFKNHLYTGNSTTNAQTIGFQPDLVWVKRRNANTNYRMYDSVNYGGPHTPGSAGGSYIYSSTNVALAAGTTNSLTSFDANGFTIHGGGGDTNLDTMPYIGWCWKAGGSPTATNAAAAGAVPTAGSVKIDGANKTDALAGGNPAKKITANTKSGFSIVKYTGTGNGAQTIAHGLSSAPELIFIKNLTDVENWCVYSRAIGNNKHLRLNSNSAASTPVNQRFNNTHPTTTVFTVGAGTTDNEVGSNGDDYVAYCWHSVAGYSSIGFYTGTNSASNGAYVNCGFKPAFVLVKSFGVGGSGYNWTAFDNNRQGSAQSTANVGYNPINSALNWNDNSQGEYTTHSIDFYGKGFKHKTSSAGTNSSTTYIYMAFAENPEKYSRGR